MKKTNKQGLKFRMRHFNRGRDIEVEFEPDHFTKPEVQERCRTCRLTRLDLLETINEWNQVGRIADGPWVYWLEP